MNWKLVEKLVRYELKWKRAYFQKALLSFCLGIGLVLTLGHDNEFTLVVSIIGGAIPLSYMLQGQTVAMSVIYNPAVNMTQGFSWKYISVSMTDRHALFVSQILSSIVSSPIFVVYVLVMFALRGRDLYYFYLLIPAFLLLLALFRIAYIRQVINYPRTLYTRSGRMGVTFIAFIKILLIGGRVFFHYGCLVMIGALVVALSLDVSRVAAIGSGSIMLFLFLVLSYRSTLRIWEDERLTHWGESMEWGKSIVYLLVASGLLISFKNIKKLDFSDPIPPLIKAIAQNDMSTVRSLITSGDSFDEVALNRPKKSCSQIVGGTPLVYAIDYSRTQAVQLLLDAGVDVNKPTQNAITPIGFAAMECKLDYLKLLKHYRANINLQVGNGHPPLFHAVQHNGCLLGVQYLLKNGADPTWTNEEGETYLEFAKRVNPKLYQELIFFMNEI